MSSKWLLLLGVSLALFGAFAIAPDYAPGTSGPDYGYGPDPGYGPGPIGPGMGGPDFGPGTGFGGGNFGGCLQLQSASGTPYRMYIGTSDVGTTTTDGLPSRSGIFAIWEAGHCK